MLIEIIFWLILTIVFLIDIDLDYFLVEVIFLIDDVLLATSIRIF